MARGWKFRIKEVKGLYYPCSEIKGADQLRGHCEADLRLCFRICKKPVLSRRGSYNLKRAKYNDIYSGTNLKMKNHSMRLSIISDRKKFGFIIYR